MIPIPLFNKDAESSLSTTGTYRLVFGKDLKSVASIPYNKRSTFNIPLISSFTVWTEETESELFLYLSFEEKDAVGRFETKESTIPMPLVYGVLAVAGLALGSLFLKRVERVIDNPTIEIGLILALVLASVYGFRLLRSILRKA